MLLTNETLSYLSLELLLTDDKRMRCLVSMRSRLQTHFMVILLIYMLFAYIYIVLLIISVFLMRFSIRFRHVIRIIESNIRLSSYEPSRRYLYGMVVLIKELSMILVYIVLCCIYKWFGLSNSNNGVNLMNIRRWLVEATFAPFIYFFFLIEYSIGSVNIVFDEYQLYFIVAIAVKLPLFILMRFAESQPDFFLNHFELFLLRKLCKLFYK